jgi:hypothetical protein
LQKINSSKGGLTVKNWKLKLVLMTIVATLAIFALTACGGSDDPAPSPSPSPALETPTPPTTPDAPTTPEVPVAPEVPADDADDYEYYFTVMHYTVLLFEDIMEELVELIEVLEWLETDEEFFEWLELFAIFGAVIDATVDELIEFSAYAPAEFLDAHDALTYAVDFVYESLHDLDFALAAGILGDYDAMWDGIEDFLVNLVTAGIIWDEVADLFVLN